MRPRPGRTTASALGLVLAALCLAPAPAYAETRTVSDERGDRPPGGLDVTRAHYTNTGPVFGARVKVADLGDRGTVYLSAMSDDGADPVDLDLKVRRAADGTVHRRVLYGTRDSVTPVPCRLRTRWSRARDVVVMSVRPRCIRHHRLTEDYDLSRPRFQVVTYRARSDRVPARWVERG